MVFALPMRRVSTPSSMTAHRDGGLGCWKIACRSMRALTSWSSSVVATGYRPSQEQRPRVVGCLKQAGEISGCQVRSVMARRSASTHWVNQDG